MCSICDESSFYKLHDQFVAIIHSARGSILPHPPLRSIEWKNRPYVGKKCPQYVILSMHITALLLINDVVRASLEALHSYGMKAPDSLVEAKDLIDSGTAKITDIALESVINVSLTMNNEHVN